LGIVLAVPAFGVLLLLVPSILTRIQDGFKTGGAGRTSIWHVDWTAFVQHPLIGWGTGNSIEAYDRNFLAVYQLYNAGWSRPPHNTALFIAVELGLVGVVLFSAAFFAAFRPLVLVQRGDALYDLRVAITASLIALLVASLFIDVSATKSLWLVLILAAQFRTVLLSRRPAVLAAYEYQPPAAAPPAQIRPRTVLGGSTR
jgi:O-antigen ligase